MKKKKINHVHCKGLYLVSNEWNVLEIKIACILDLRSFLYLLTSCDSRLASTYISLLDFVCDLHTAVEKMIPR